MYRYVLIKISMSDVERLIRTYLRGNLPNMIHICNKKIVVFNKNDNSSSFVFYARGFVRGHLKKLQKNPYRLWIR